jgi:uncharacterized membrane protein YeaQ/YmgE (transglycosylase-associated protein family)
MEIFLGILFGLAVGSVAKLIMPGPSAGGILVAIFVGVGGALIGGLIGANTPGGMSMGFDVRTLLMSITGALFLLLSYRCFALRTGT